MIRFPHTPGLPAGIFHVGHGFFNGVFRKSCWEKEELPENPWIPWGLHSWTSRRNFGKEFSHSGVASDLQRSL